MSPVKEPNYFASEICMENFAEEHGQRIRQDMQAMQDYLAGPMSKERFGAVGLKWEDYLKLFRDAGDQEAIGEASVMYLWSENAAKNIAEKIPDAKIILILRDPAERAFSQYKQLANKGRTMACFSETCSEAMKTSDGKFRAFRPFLELGLYADGVKRYLDLFPRENVHIAFYEDYQRDARATFAIILGFLKVDPNFEADMSKRYLVGTAGCAMGLEDRRLLVEFYKDDIGKLARLLNCDLSRWER